MEGSWIDEKMSNPEFRAEYGRERERLAKAEAYEEAARVVLAAGGLCDLCQERGEQDEKVCQDWQCEHVFTIAAAIRALGRE